MNYIRFLFVLYWFATFWSLGPCPPKILDARLCLEKHASREILSFLKTFQLKRKLKIKKIKNSTENLTSMI